jgi:DNA sulfur modification protein DndB
MKLTAIRGYIGTNVYYVTTLTFAQINDQVSRVDEHLHKASSLGELIQRSLTDNVHSLATYIQEQPDLFFNSIVLAVYDNYPRWQEVVWRFDDQEIFSVGLLEFPGPHKIFPVDGQHRVEGIKQALNKNPNLSNNRVPVIFISHQNTKEGLVRTRRLFSSLNRYAKPVTLDNIIALDEDDIIAIVTRRLLESNQLFREKRISLNHNKAIDTTDKKSFTSLVTLYECNIELFKLHRHNIKGEAMSGQRLTNFLKIRPDDDSIGDFLDYANNFWDALRDTVPSIGEYNIDDSDRPAENFRDSYKGGLIFFRPVGLLPFVQACCTIVRKRGMSFTDVLSIAAEIPVELNAIPWKGLVWNDISNTMIMGNQLLTRLLFIHYLNGRASSDNELLIITQKLKAALGKENVEEYL